MRNYKHFWEKEREIIYLWLQEWLSKQKIAKKVNRHPSSIWREIKRSSSLLNISLNWNKEAKEDKNNYHYLPDRANIKQKKKRSMKTKTNTKMSWLFLCNRKYKKVILSWNNMLKNERDELDLDYM